MGYLDGIYYDYKIGCQNQFQIENLNFLKLDKSQNLSFHKKVSHTYTLKLRYSRISIFKVAIPEFNTTNTKQLLLYMEYSSSVLFFVLYFMFCQSQFAMYLFDFFYNIIKV